MSGLSRIRTETPMSTTTHGNEASPKVESREEAFAILDRLNARGLVQQWTEHKARRYDELWTLIDSLDEDYHDWQTVRRLKLTAHTIAKDREQGT